MKVKPTRIIEKKYKDDVRRLSAYWPAEFPTIEDLGAGKRSIRLQSGAIHEFDEVEVERLLSIIPSYFQRFMRVPLLLRYEKSGGIAKYKVMGDVWQRRLVELLIRGDYSFNGLEEISVEEFINLLTFYKSLIFVTLMY